MTNSTRKALLQRGNAWFKQQGWKAFPFQRQAWEAYLSGKSGLVNAPTGSGKTYSLILPILLEFLGEYPDRPTKTNNGLRAIWITPIRALTREIQGAAERAIEDLGMKWRVGIRSGDTKTAERTKQRSKPPEILITTPESLHLLIASKGYEKFFGDVNVLVCDEWHELLGTKRGVLVELALSRLRALRGRDFRTWGISATIGNMEEALDVLVPASATTADRTIIRAESIKYTEMVTVMPDRIETFPWAGTPGHQVAGKGGADHSLLGLNAHLYQYAEPVRDMVPALARCRPRSLRRHCHAPRQYRSRAA